MLHSQEKLTPEQKQMARRRRILQGRAAQGICILAAFAAISLFAAGWLLLRQDRTFSDSENRMLAQKPSLTLASLADGSFAEGLERWYADQFPGRDLWITADLTFQRALGVREMNGVYLGADGYLLEAPAQEDAAQLGQTEAAICAFAAQHPDIRLTAAIVPNAWGVLSEKLPAGAPVEDQKALIDAIDQAMPDVRTANLTEALRSGAEIKTVLVRRGFESGELRQAEKQGAAMYCAEDALFCLASEVESPQNVIFSCMQPQWDAAALDDREQVLLLDGLQDPGNLGTILRTAEAFALGAVVLCEGCADPFSPKVVRSTMGAVFRLPCVQLPLADALARLKTAGLPVYATALHEDSVPLSSVSLGRAAVIIGSEGRGVSESALRLSDRRVIIPMHGRAESLNAGVAAAIVIYEMTK